MSDDKKNEIDNEFCNPGDVEKIQHIHELRPAVSIDDIKKAVDTAGPNERDIMDKLDQKDHS